MSRDSLLLITTSYPDAGDGSEAAGAFVADVAEELATRIPVRVVGPGLVESAPRVGRAPAVWRFASGGRPLSLLSPKSPSDWPHIARILLSMRRQARAATADGRVAHVVAFWALPCGWLARGLWRSDRIPYSLWALGSDIWTLGKLPGIARLLGGVVKDAHGRFADGLQLAEDATRLGGRPFEFLPSARRTLLATGVTLRPRAPWRLLFLGRWHLNKGIDLLLDALWLLPEDTWAAIDQITIAGGGPLEAQVRAGVAALQAVQRPIRLRGFLSAAQAAEAVSDSDWLLIPSRIESIPIVLSDALKAGRPVVVTAVGDMERIVGSPHACGIVAKQATAESIASAIVEAMLYGPGPFIEGVRAAAATFDLKSIADRLLAVADVSSS